MTERMEELIDEINLFIEKSEKERSEILVYLSLVDRRSEQSRMSLRALLHALPTFYTAVETLLRHAVELFGNGVGGEAWHKELLQKAYRGRNGIRPPILSVETYNILDDFRGFRHFCRYNAYIGDYSVERVKENGRKYERLVSLLREDLLRFADFLKNSLERINNRGKGSRQMFDRQSGIADLSELEVEKSNNEPEASLK